MARDDLPDTIALTGADVVLRTLLRHEVDVCFANPGTSEMHFIAALDRKEGMRCILGLAETVVTGAADGYGRISGKPAVTLLHTGLGLANGLANLHNARRAPSPILNLIGEHATYHRQFDTPLASDIESFAAPVSHWVGRAQSVDTVAADTLRGIVEARRASGRVATLILPADICWSMASSVDFDQQIPPVSNEVRLPTFAAVEALKSDEPSMLLLGGNLDEDLLERAAGIAAACGARLAVETFPTRLAAGGGRPSVMRLPYLPEMLHASMSGVRHLVLVGAQRPVTFFAYPDIASDAVPGDCKVHILAEHDDEIGPVVADLARAVGVSNDARRNILAPPCPPRGDLNPFSLAQAIAAYLPEGAILVDEAITGGMALFPALASARPHDWLFQTGGAIGWGLPAAIGAAVAAPDRKVVCVEGDGSALYSIQALWTMAREKLDVTVIILANRDYAILKTEYARVGAAEIGEQAKAMMSIGNPDIDFVEIAGGFGVPASRVKTADELCVALAAAINLPGPRLIEAVLPALDPAFFAR